MLVVVVELFVPEIHGLVFCVLIRIFGKRLNHQTAHAVPDKREDLVLAAFGKSKFRKNAVCE